MEKTPPLECKLTFTFTYCEATDNSNSHITLRHGCVVLLPSKNINHNTMPPRKAAPSAETPQRVTRARSKTPLPAIGQQQATAYGAAGKANLGQQIRGQNDGFSTAFEEDRTTDAGMAPPAIGTRGTSASLLDDAGSDAAASRTADRRRRQHSGVPPVIPEERAESERRQPSSPAEPDTTLPRGATHLDHAAEYGGIFANLRAGMVRQLNDPNSLTYVLILTFLTLTIGFVSGIISMFMPLPGSMVPARENFFWRTRALFGQSPYDRPPDFLELSWQKFKNDDYFLHKLPQANLPDLQWAVNGWFQDRLEKLEKRVATIEELMALHSDTLSEMQQMLPRHILVQEIDGKLEIPADFWAALQDRLVQDTGVAPLWQKWLSRNENQIAGVMQDYTDATLNDRLENAQIVTQDRFLQLFDEKNEWLMAQYRDQVSEFWKKQSADVKNIASQTALDELEKNPTYQLMKGQLQTLLHFNHIHNTFNTLRDTNFFSPTLGARVDPHLTSPTKGSGAKNWLSAIYLGLNPLYAKPNPPIMALVKWDEAGDCWCGSLGGKDHVQIAVLTDSFYPKDLIVEHITKHSTRDLNAAPRAISIWMELGSITEATQFIQYQDKTAEGYADQNKCGVSPGSKFACIGTGEYYIDRDDRVQSDHIQSFGLWLDMEEFQKADYSTRKVIVRAESNWGQNYTCFYRLRMTGEGAKEHEAVTGWRDWLAWLA
jgi:hypothetical protein